MCGPNRRVFAMVLTATEASRVLCNQALGEPHVLEGMLILERVLTYIQSAVTSNYVPLTKLESTGSFIRIHI